MKLLKAWIRGNLIARLLDRLGSRSIILGYPLHLNHENLNCAYSPIDISIGSPPMGKGRKIMLQHQNSVQI